MTIFRFSSAVMAILIATSLSAQTIPSFEPPLHKFKSGNELLGECTTSESDPAYSRKYLACLGYISGAIDQHESLVSVGRAQRQFCLRPNVNLGQLADIVVIWLQRNPENRDLTASFLITLALQDAFPCTGGAAK